MSNEPAHPQRSEGVPNRKCMTHGCQLSGTATSEPQEFRVIGAEVFDAKGVSLYRFGTRRDAHDVCNVINAALSAERIILNNVRVAAEDAWQQLLAAQAAIERLIQLKGKCPWCGYIPHTEGCFMSLDFFALREHDAKVKADAYTQGYAKGAQEQHGEDELVRKPLSTADLRLAEAKRLLLGAVGTLELAARRLEEGEPGLYKWNMSVVQEKIVAIDAALAEGAAMNDDRAMHLSQHASRTGVDSRKQS